MTDSLGEVAMKSEGQISMQLRPKNILSFILKSLTSIPRKARDSRLRAEGKEGFLAHAHPFKSSKSSKNAKTPKGPPLPKKRLVAKVKPKPKVVA